MPDIKSECTATLSLSTQWWTPKILARETGKNEDTVNRRFLELVQRGVMKKKPGRRIWNRDEAQTLADYIVAFGRVKK
ncbi:MAG TPA: hypothetical protein VF719_01510 [Abditibacteriaceae bacterium]|jgi:DNA-binding transcriptional regulator YhcF (GntR family)